MPIQLLCGLSPFCIQNEQAELSAPRLVFYRSHQLTTQTCVPSPAMDQHLRNLSAMRLVRCPGRVQLDGTNNPFDIASDEEDRPRIECRNGFDGFVPIPKSESRICNRAPNC